MKCPVCESNMTSLVCACGYDESRDYAQYPVLAPVKNAEPVSALRAKRTPKDAVRCEKCGGTAFTIRIPDGTRQCNQCGWSPDPKPLIECACGGRYFQVRASDGGLMCPLCSRDILLDDLIARVRPVPNPKPQAVPVKEAPKPAPQPAARNKHSLIPTPLLPFTPPKEARNKPAITAIAAGDNHTVVLYSDGTVGAVGSNDHNKCAVGDWTEITAIAVGENHTVGLKQDGTVVACGLDRDRQCSDTLGWKNVTAIAVGNYFTVGLHKDGGLFIAGCNFGSKLKARYMDNLTAIAAGEDFILGLNRKHQILTTDSAMADTASWHKYIAIAAGSSHTVGLLSDGKPVAMGNNAFGKCETDWFHIVDVSAGRNHTVGLKKDGTVVAAGLNTNGQCAVDSWRNITAISAGRNYTVGLRADGTPVATGANSFGQCDVQQLVKR